MRVGWVLRVGVLLCLTLVAVLAGAATAAGKGKLPNPDSQGLTKGVTSVRELPQLRSEDSVTFLQSDGSRLLRIADHPINFKRGGAWVPIDDKLVQAGNGSWEPTASPVPVSLPVGLAAHGVKIGAGARQISLTLQGAEGASGVASGNQRSYSGVMKGVDLAYATTTRGVRETLTLANSAAPSEYHYALGLPSGLHAAMKPGGALTVSDSEGHTLYTIAAPTISDSSRSMLPTMHPVRYALNTAGTELTLTVDKTWLASSSRVFPVRIDPDVYFGTIKDCSIASGAYEDNELCGTKLFIGNNGSATARLF